MDDLITTTTIFSPKTFKKTFTKVHFNNASFGEFMRIFLKKCEAKAKRIVKLLMRSEAKRIRFASLFFALMRIRNANSHDCEKLRSEANSLRFASHKMDSTSLRFRFAIFKMRSLSLRFRNLNRLRVRRAKSAKISLFPGIFFVFTSSISPLY